MDSRTAALPKTFRKIVVKKYTTNFSEATEIITCPMPTVNPKEVLIKTSYLGINAADIQLSAGRYFAPPSPPMDLGFEAIGEIVAVGTDVHHLKTGQPVAYMGIDAFADHLCVPAEKVLPVPSLKPEYIPILVSGRTATISLDKMGQIKKGDKVLITAAAGGLGRMAVQYAKHAECHVIGTCSSEEKEQLLKELKCDRPINYRKENLEEVLKSEYPDGVDVVLESIGGEVFKTCLNNLAVRGRLIVVGHIAAYQSHTDGYQPIDLGHLPKELLARSTSVSGFRIFHFAEEFEYYHKKILGMQEKGTLRIFVDLGENTERGAFVGLESVARAVDYLHSGTSKGKVIVQVTE